MKYVSVPAIFLVILNLAGSLPTMASHVALPRLEVPLMQGQLTSCDDASPEPDPEPEPEPEPEPIDEMTPPDTSPTNIWYQAPTGLAKIYTAACDGVSEKVTANKGDTDRASKAIEDAAELCAPLDSAYRIDCLASRYEALARSPVWQGEYEDAGKALKSAAKKLRQVADTARDASQPMGKVTRDRNGIQKPYGRRLTPIKPAALAAANTAALKIVEETQTVLLRSVGNSTRRQVNYQQIAMALDSNKVLLRS